jgi:hypothetical protein
MGLNKKGRLQGQLFTNPHKIPKGNIPWNKGLVGFRASKDRVDRVKKICKNCDTTFKVLPSKIDRIYCSTKCSRGHKIRRGPEKFSIESRLKMSAVKLGVDLSVGNNRELLLIRLSYNERKSPQYIAWRTAVYERDNYTCKICDNVGGKLNADHIKPWSLFVELRYNIDNGRTLCEDCHKKTDSYLKPLKHLKEIYSIGI